MTYGELGEMIMRMTPEQLNQTATVMDGAFDECYGIDTLQITDETCDIVDVGSVLLVINYF